jgi:hypothetical protein
MLLQTLEVVESLNRDYPKVLYVGGASAGYLDLYIFGFGGGTYSLGIRL